MQLLAQIASANAARAVGDCEGGVAGHHLELVFCCSQWLAVYGTLAVGEENHREVVNCRGIWQGGTVHGRRGMHQYPVFRFDATAPPVAMQVLHSTNLPAHWAALDEFEGPGYRRVLVPVLLASGWQVANLYEALAQVD